MAQDTTSFGRLWLNQPSYEIYKDNVFIPDDPVAAELVPLRKPSWVIPSQSGNLPTEASYSPSPEDSGGYLLWIGEIDVGELGLSVKLNENGQTYSAHYRIFQRNLNEHPKISILDGAYHAKNPSQDLNRYMGIVRPVFVRKDWDQYDLFLDVSVRPGKSVSVSLTLELPSGQLVNQFPSYSGTETTLADYLVSSKGYTVRATGEIVPSTTHKFGVIEPALSIDTYTNSTGNFDLETGRVGIHTAVPSEAFHVDSDTLISSAVTGDGLPRNAFRVSGEGIAAGTYEGGNALAPFFLVTPGKVSIKGDLEIEGSIAYSALSTLDKLEERIDQLILSNPESLVAVEVSDIIEIDRDITLPEALVLTISPGGGFRFLDGESVLRIDGEVNIGGLFQVFYDQQNPGQVESKGGWTRRPEFWGARALRNTLITSEPQDGGSRLRPVSERITTSSSKAISFAIHSGAIVPPTTTLIRPVRVQLSSGYYLITEPIFAWSTPTKQPIADRSIASLNLVGEGTGATVLACDASSPGFRTGSVIGLPAAIIVGGEGTLLRDFTIRTEMYGLAEKDDPAFEWGDDSSDYIQNTNFCGIVAIHNLSENSLIDNVAIFNWGVRGAGVAIPDDEWLAALDIDFDSLHGSIKRRVSDDPNVDPIFSHLGMPTLNNLTIRGERTGRYGIYIGRNATSISIRDTTIGNNGGSEKPNRKPLDAGIRILGSGPTVASRVHIENAKVPILIQDNPNPAHRSVRNVDLTGITGTVAIDPGTGPDMTSAGIRIVDCPFGNVRIANTSFSAHDPQGAFNSSNSLPVVPVIIDDVNPQDPNDDVEIKYGSQFSTTHTLYIRSRIWRDNNLSYEVFSVPKIP